MASLQTARDRFIEAQLAGDRREALRVVEQAVHDGMCVADIREEVICAGQREVGRLWNEGRIGVGDEHAATAVAQVALAGLYQLATPGAPRDGLVLVSCVPGELHEFPARVLADALDLGGYRVRFLGADVALEVLLETIRKTRPDVLALSATMDYYLASMRSAVEAVRSRFPGLPVLVGGAVCGANHAALEAMGDGCGATALDGPRLVERCLAGER